MTNCPCEGVRSIRWHHRRDLKPCQAANDRKAERQRNRRAGIPAWVPGTDILEELVEEL